MIKVLSKRIIYFGRESQHVEHFGLKMKNEGLGWEHTNTYDLWRVKVNGAYHWEQVGGVKITDAETLNEIQRLYNEYLKKNGGVE